MRPVVHGLEEQYGKEIAFVYLDIDNPSTRPLKDKWGFRYQPHFILVGAEGDVVQEWVGYVESTEFEQAFEAVALDPPGAD